MLPDVCFTLLAETIPPERNRFASEFDTPFAEQILHIEKRPRKADAEHLRQADDPGIGLEVAEWVGFHHPTTLRNCSVRPKNTSIDSARLSGLNAVFLIQRR